MDLPELDAALSDQLTEEFPARGRRAIESLRAAHALLRLEPDSLPQHGALVAYCLRDVLVEIAKTSEISVENRRNALSGAVVEAKAQYERALESSDEETVRIARQELFSRIDDLGAFLDEPGSVNQERLKALFRQRTGTEPLSSGTAPLREYQRLLDACSSAGHNGCSLDEARRLSSASLELLQRFFLAHDRDPEPLRQLAGVESPSDDDLDDLRRRLTTPVELQAFLRRVEAPGWLWKLAQSGALEMPDSSLWWAACTAAIRVSDAHRDEVVRWLEEMHPRHAAKPAHVRCFAYAARRIGADALDLLLRIVQRHPTDERIALEGLDAALGLEAAHPMVIEFADALLNMSSWDLLHTADDLAAHAASGVDEDNALDRVRRIGLKLRQVEDDIAIRDLRSTPSGTMDDAHTVFPRERASAVLESLTRMLRAAWEWHPASALLACIDDVPEPARARLRAWVFGNAPDVDADALAAEVAAAIATREATGDDVALVERALALGDSDVLRASWLDAMGDAPDAAEVGRALDDREPLPRHTWRVSSWVPILPEKLAGAWAGPCQVLSDEFGEVSREELLTRDLPRMRQVGSPVAEPHFADMSPMDAAAAIAQWRFAAADFYVSARGLGRVLQKLVAENPADWLADPVGIVRALHHPTYISAYLRAAETPTDFTATVAARLVDAAGLAASEPWEVVRLGRSGHHYEPDWRETRRAAIELIGKIAAAGARFGGRADDAWKLIEDAARRRTSSGDERRDDQQSAQADAQASARALELAVRFADAELRASRPLRPELEPLLDHSLRLSGELGLEHRNVIASHIRWLRYWLPEWTDAAMARIIGSDAPGGLGEATFESVLRLNAPSRWLCETYPDRIRDAARRQRESALRHVLVAMLYGWDAYSIEAVAQFLQRNTELIPEAARQIAGLLGHEEVDQGQLAVGVELWETLLDSTAASSLAAFGWMSIVDALEDARWTKLTRKTVEAAKGQYGWDEQVAKRAMAEPLTADKLAILDLLVRHTPSDWVRRIIADNSEALLGVGPGLAATPEYRRLRTALIGHGLAKAG
ncbi:hypothetical protein [Candidatus Poriferisodalis sp.]|uniref:hypothetical protein n=1 Tax=Candidatus Poriferisodalis sp. TaxID=3101277 RepID=UPI003B01F6D2